MASIGQEFLNGAVIVKAVEGTLVKSVTLPATNFQEDPIDIEFSVALEREPVEALFTNGWRPGE
jgi:hypothetical protein